MRHPQLIEHKSQCAFHPQFNLREWESTCVSIQQTSAGLSLRQSTERGPCRTLLKEMGMSSARGSALSSLTNLPSLQAFLLFPTSSVIQTCSVATTCRWFRPKPATQFPSQILVKALSLVENLLITMPPPPFPLPVRSMHEDHGDQHKDFLDRYFPLRCAPS